MKIAVIHFLPIEYYPPATNIIGYLSDRIHDSDLLYVFTTHNSKNRKVYKNPQTKIYRFKSAIKNRYRIFRLLKYLNFNISVFFKLLFSQPDKIIYFETLSAFPPYLYIKYIRKKTAVFTHYHEYTSLYQYARKSMAIERFFHRLEIKYLYKMAAWISHTNMERIQLFQKDYPFVNASILHEMPNYPPKSWHSFRKLNNYTPIFPIKCVYIGSLSFENTYLKEFVDWVIRQKGNFSFDIYSYNMYPDIQQYLNNFDNPLIRLHDSGIEYNDIPSTLSDYQIGIIFYKPYSENVIHCVSNKFYEYISCGLDVWFSDIMKSTLKYVSYDHRPKIVPVDFSNLDDFNWKPVIKEAPIGSFEHAFFSDSVYSVFNDAILNT